MFVAIYNNVNIAYRYIGVKSFNEVHFLVLIKSSITIIVISQRGSKKFSSSPLLKKNIWSYEITADIGWSPSNPSNNKIIIIIYLIHRLPFAKKKICCSIVDQL